MEENELYNRIGETDLNPTYKDGQTYQHTDINQMLGILKTAINENYYDIQRLLNGAKTVGNANQLDDATLSRYIDEELQSDDNKIPSSQQAKAYMDALFAGYSAPVRGVDYWTEADQQQIVSDTANNVIEEITPDLEEELAAKANINDIPTKISDLQNDSDFLSENNLQMVNTANIENGTQLTDATGYARLNKIYGNTVQNGTPTPVTPINVNIVSGDIDVSISNSDQTLQENYVFSLGNIELCKIEDRQDYIYQKNGKWFLHKECSHYTFKGDSNVDLYEYNSDGTNTLRINLKPLKANYAAFKYNSASAKCLYSNYFNYSYATSDTEHLYITGGEQTGSNFNGNIRMYIAHDRLTGYSSSLTNAQKIELVKNWLVNNNLEVIYIMKTPIDVEINDIVLLNQLDTKLSFYKNETNFVMTSDDLAPYLNMTYAITDRDIYSKEEVDDIIYKNKNEITNQYNKILFMPVNDSIQSSVAAGDCSVIITTKGKVVMIDTGASHSYDLIKEELLKNGVRKIDYMIITHFHGDHTGNINSLANDFDLSSTVYYIQKHTDVPTDITSGSEQSVLDVAQNNIVLRPNTNDTLIVDDIKITFMNCNQSDIDYYDSQNTTVNNYSICCYVEYGNNTFLFTGDIFGLATENLYNQGLLKKVDVVKGEHHGNQTNSFSNYNLSIMPDYTILSNSENSNDLRGINHSPSILLKNSLGSKVYSTKDGTIELYFNKDNYAITDAMPVSSNPRTENPDQTCCLYVDSTYSGKSDGTSNKPFRTLERAIAYSRLFKNVTVTIYIIGEYISQESLCIISQPNPLRIIGSFTCNDISILKSNFYCNGTITITSTQNYPFNVNGSTISLNEVIINGDTTSQETATNGIGARFSQSIVNIETLNISNRSLGFVVYNASTARMHEIKGTNNTYGYFVPGSSLLFVGIWNNDFATSREYSGYSNANEKSEFVQFSSSAVQRLSRGDDLNDYVIPGKYISQNGDITGTLNNRPTGINYAFTLEVKTLNTYNNTMQTIISSNLAHTSTGIYVRVYDHAHNTWSAWKTVIQGS